MNVIPVELRWNQYRRRETLACLTVASPKSGDGPKKVMKKVFNKNVYNYFISAQ